jgi:hypothetical protein
MTKTGGARRAWPVLAVALVLRLLVIAFSARMTVDVLRYHKIATHVLDVSWDPYQAPRLYPYPPLWIGFEAAALWLERHGLSFPVVVKLPVAAAEIGIVAILAAWSRRAAWVYALHPVSLLVSGVHGQFDALMILFVLASLRSLEVGRADRSALGLAGAIATKSVPVLLLPAFVLALPEGRARRLRFALLAVLPVVLALMPFAIHDFGALHRELAGYGGIADFGWIGVLRGWLFSKNGHLIKAYPEHWGVLIPIAKVAFLAAYAALVFWRARGTARLALPDFACAVFLAFLVFYGSISAQYLLWPIALGARKVDRYFVAYSVAATFALIGFYAFLAPGVLFDDEVARTGGGPWALGATAVLITSAAWLAALVRRR